MDESKPTEQTKASQPDVANDEDEGFTLEELMLAHSRNFDHEGRLVRRSEEGDYTPGNGQQ